MAAKPAVHPSEDALRAFALGKLDDATSSVLMSHLDGCPDCCKVVAALSGDDFLHRLRQAQGGSSTPAPLKSLADVAGTPPSPTSPESIPNLPPELVANQQYEILCELGRGGMGVVYLAKNKLMDRLEVLKVVNKTLLDHPGAIERFLREIRSAAKLSHANVVGAYSAVQQGELLAFAMEYVEGKDLASLVKAQGPLPVPHACFYGQQAALGLQHAFEKQMVHRDVKPQNLILAREGRKRTVKVLDFGLAKVMRERTEDTGLTGEGKMLGTPDYIAPEQALDAAKADIRADIYSLGCTLYYLLAGRPPFSGTSLSAVLMAHQMQEARPLNLVRPEVPEELAAVVRKMMAKSPAKRYQTPLEVVQALAPFVRQGATPKASPELSSGATEAKSAVKKAASIAPPLPPMAESPKQPPTPPAMRESRTERSVTSVGPRKSGAVPKLRAATVRERKSPNKWLIGGGIGVGVLLLALLELWANGVFKVKTKDGMIVLENVPPDAEVVVDGETVTLRDQGGKAIEISVAARKKHQLQVKKEGFKVFGNEVEIDAGESRAIHVSLEPLPVAAAAQRQEVPASEVERRATKWALALQGTAQVRVRGEVKKIHAVGNLPAERFELLEIDLTSKPVGDDGLAKLKGATNLTRLVLWNAGISDAGLEHLKDLTSLKELHLFANPNVTDAGLAHLKRLTNLSALDLNATRVTDAGLVHLKGFTNLTLLNLMNTRISGAGFVHLEGLTKITVLDLDNSTVEDIGLAHLESLSNLNMLAIRRTRVSDAGLVHLKGLKKLRDLYMSETKATQAGVADLQKALPECHIHTAPE
jgi:serine/threonine protein kinase